MFPIILDVDNPNFILYLENCAEANQNLIDIEKDENSDFIKLFTKLPQYFKMVTNLLNLYLLPAIETKYIWTEK